MKKSQRFSSVMLVFLLSTFISLHCFATGVTTFVLVNTDTHQPVAGFNPLLNGAVVNLATLKVQHLSIQAMTSPYPVGSVIFKLGSDSSHLNYSHVENIVPYSLCGDNGNNYGQNVCTNLGVGPHTVTATAYSGGQGTGTVLGQLSVAFSIVSGTTPPTTTPPPPTPTVAPPVSSGGSTTVLGTVAPNSTLTISGSGFGSTGPKIMLMEDFEHDTVGQKVQLSGAPVGAWTGYNNPADSYLASSNAHTGKVGYHAYDYAAQAASILNLNMGNNYQEVFISFWVEIPPGATFPGEFNLATQSPPGPAAGQFAGDSSWKMAWLMDGQEGYKTAGAFDLVAPTYAGDNQVFIAGEKYNFYGNTAYSTPSLGMGDAWWSWSSWNRISIWLRGGSALPTGGTAGYAQTLNSQKGMTTFNFGNIPLFQNGVSQQFNWLNMPGWVRENSQSTTDPTYDDIYVAAGPGAVARVELTDSSSYSQSRHSTILQVVTWSDGQITAKIPRAGLDFTGQSYLYITNANGQTNATGIPVP